MMLESVPTLHPLPAQHLLLLGRIRWSWLVKTIVLLVIVSNGSIFGRVLIGIMHTVSGCREAMERQTMTKIFGPDVATVVLLSVTLEKFGNHSPHLDAYYSLNVG
ncbi:uncharacterized protein C8R40DRAFT_612530 [Lentinula edodes]|uniref:uncharacterized protein n=1 Tax=Lentinula edodes TaxID=5353 RepID=UPI001E8EAB80|nr:uncharacterized protein C8R40DRAFT_612530 [Lentinula edodes]KAH7870859.1 hypothetical protein C8R40DRAFT_612530 [Lentinula edodes]